MAGCMLSLAAFAALMSLVVSVLPTSTSVISFFSALTFPKKNSDIITSSVSFE